MSQRTEKDVELLVKLKENLPELENLLADITEEWTYEDLIYRFYHQSFKVYRLQEHTNEIVTALKALLPDQRINAKFEQIWLDGTGKRFEMAHNQRWMEETRPILEAFFHAKYFLEMAVKYGRELKTTTSLLPSGWAGFLYFYNIR